MDILTILEIAIEASTQLSKNKVSFESVVEKQDKALEILEHDITIDKSENNRIQQTLEMKKIKSQDELAKLYNKAQEIRVYLSYYVNKLGGGDTRSLSVGSTTYFKEEPKEALKDLLERNAEDLKILKRAIPILHLGKVKTGGKRKRTIRNKRKYKKRRSRRKKGSGPAFSKPKRKTIVKVTPEATLVPPSMVNVVPVYNAQFLTHTPVAAEVKITSPLGKGGKRRRKKTRKKRKRRRKHRKTKKR